MTYSFRPGIRENVGLLIALAGASGSGKTYSAMRMAAGIVGPGNKFAVLDTEARRALHYADQFDFDHCEIQPPFRPDAYADAIKAAGDAGYRAIVIDSTSHEWAGEGGVLDMQEEEIAAMVKRAQSRERENRSEYALRESFKMASWIKPKMAHKVMVQRLLQSRAHLIFCLRAEEKVEIVRDQGGKTQIIPKGYQPICAKDFMFEMTASFLLLPDKPGIGQPIKLQEQHRPLFPAGAAIGEDSGKRIAAWARGGAVEEKVSTAAARPAAQTAPAPTAGPAKAPAAPVPAATPPAPEPRVFFIRKGTKDDPCADIEEWRSRMLKGIDALPDQQCEALLDMNAADMAAHERGYPEDVQIVREAFVQKIGRGE